MPKARAKAAEAMRSVLYDEIVSIRPQESDLLAAQLATLRAANSYFKPVIRNFVGRPGLDPGTLGLKGTCKLSLCDSLVAYVFSFHGNVLILVGLVSWCCRNMRPKMRPIRT
jgi:hypothetical protein